MNRIVIYYFFKCLLHFTFKIEGKYYDSFSNLIRPHSYRLGGISKSQVKNNLFFLAKAIKMIFNRSQFFEWDLGENSSAILHDSKKAIDINKKYIADVTGYLPNLHFLKSQPPHQNSLKKRLKTLSSLGLIYPFLFIIWIIFSKRRNSISLITVNFSEWVLTLQAYKNNNVNRVYYFGGFENDANFFSVLAGKFEIKLTKVCSPNPISIYYQKTIADTFAFSVPYQREEYEQLKCNWYVNKLVDWPPFHFKELVKAINNSNPNFELGFLSSGTWRRRERGDFCRGDGEYETEEKLINFINSIPNQLVNDIMVFLHPNEKENTDLFEKAKGFYYQKLKNKKVSFAPIDKPSYQNFYLADLCISGYSSSAQERIFMGYKTLLAPIAMQNKYYEGLSIESIVSYGEENLLKNIEKALATSNKAFFEAFGLEKYTYQNYQQFLN